MRRGIIALGLAGLATLAIGLSGSKDDLSMLSETSAQSAEAEKRLSCAEGEVLEEYLAPGATVNIEPGHSVSSHKARYVTRNGRVTVDICLAIRKFVEGQYAERRRVEISGDSGTVYVYLQEKNLQRTRR